MHLTHQHQQAAIQHQPGPRQRCLPRAPAQHQWRCRARLTHVAASGTAEASSPAEELTGPDKERWEEGIRLLQEAGVEDSIQVLGQAWGWGNQKYWWKEKVREAPQPEGMRQNLNYLREELGLEGEDLAGVIQGFPEALALDLEKRIKPNVKALGDRYYMKTKQLKVKTIKRKPAIALGFTTDCQGDCQGDCTRCAQHL